LFPWWQPFRWVRWNLNVILICISLMTKDVECFLRYLLAILYTPFENSHIQFICLFVLCFLAAVGLNSGPHTC
jgi:hypothetical protein